MVAAADCCCSLIVVEDSLEVDLSVRSLQQRETLVASEHDGERLQKSFSCQNEPRMTSCRLSCEALIYCS